ncbi:MAG: alpha/beta fold hydrolase [Chloroflexota bacterium]|nr:alpha/beta fold hydrolase [Chloroflexota bacterium]
MSNYLTLPPAEPFFLSGNRTGCLLIHGFTGSPAGVRGLGEFLNQQGYTALGIRLPGHGTRPQDLRHVRWRDWLAAVEDGLNLLKGSTDRVFVLGLSMGGVLTLIAASRYPVAGAVAMSAPFGLQRDWRLRFIRPLSLVVPQIKKPPSGGADLESSYPYFVTHALAEAAELAKMMQAGLPQIEAPVLLIQSRRDAMIEPDALTLLNEHLKTPHKETLWLEESGHVITLDVEQEIVFQAAADFIRRVTGE